jgi:hypothetical protein
MYVIKMVGTDKFKISVDCVVVSTYLLYKGCCVFFGKSPSMRTNMCGRGVDERSPVLVDVIMIDR